MVIETKLLSILAVRSLSLEQIGEVFGLTQDELDDPNCGLWIADEIKQLKTTQILMRTEQMRRGGIGVPTYIKGPFIRASQTKTPEQTTLASDPKTLSEQTDTGE